MGPTLSGSIAFGAGAAATSETSFSNVVVSEATSTARFVHADDSLDDGSGYATATEGGNLFWVFSSVG